MKDYPVSTWVAVDSVTTDTTSSAKEFTNYDYAELNILSEVATAWAGTVQVQGSTDNSTFSNVGSSITTAGMYFIDPLPKYVKLVTTRTAGTLQCEITPVIVH